MPRAERCQPNFCARVRVREPSEAACTLGQRWRAVCSVLGFGVEAESLRAVSFVRHSMLAAFLRVHASAR